MQSMQKFQFTFS